MVCHLLFWHQYFTNYDKKGNYVCTCTCTTCTKIEKLPKKQPKHHQKGTKNYWFCCKITQILSQNLPTFFTKISAIFPRKLVCVMWWPYVPNMVPTCMAGTKWFRGCSKLMSGRRATWVAPKVSEFDSAGAESVKSHIQIYQKHAYIGTNRFFMFHIVAFGCLINSDKSTYK